LQTETITVGGIMMSNEGPGSMTLTHDLIDKLPF
jgi:hypothetical protein